MNIFVMIMNYLHDVAVALLAANILAVYFIGRYLDKNPVADSIIPNLFRALKRITYVVLAYILIGGALRAYFFMDFEWNPAVGKGQITALIVKHVLLFALTVFGIAAHIRYSKKYGRKK